MTIIISKTVKVPLKSFWCDSQLVLLPAPMIVIQINICSTTFASNEQQYTPLCSGCMSDGIFSPKTYFDSEKLFSRLSLEKSTSEIYANVGVPYEYMMFCVAKAGENLFPCCFLWAPKITSPECMTECFMFYHSTNSFSCFVWRWRISARFSLMKMFALSSSLI